MFRIEEALASWRMSFSKRSAISNAQFEELETHILEAFETGIENGMSPSAAFEQAIANIGAPAELEKEYRKLVPVRERLFNISRGVYITTVLFISGFSAVFSIKTGYGPMLLNRISDFDTFTLTSVFVALVAFIAPLTAILISLSYLKSSALRWGAIAVLILFIAWRFAITGPSVMSLSAPTMVLLLSYFTSGKRLLYFVTVLVALYLGLCTFVAFEAYVDLLARNSNLFVYNVAAFGFDIFLGLCMALGLAQRSGQDGAEGIPAKMIVE